MASIPSHPEAATSYRTRLYNSYFTGQVADSTNDARAMLELRGPGFSRLIKRHFPADRSASILDLGCGYGALLYYINALGYENARGVDASPEQVRTARSLGVHGVEQGDVMASLETTPTASLDVVVTFDLLEHLTRQEAFQVLDEVNRVLRPGGRWIIHVPNAASPFGGASCFGDLSHEHSYSPRSMRQLLRAGGFTRITCYEDGPAVHGLLSGVRAVSWALIRTAWRVHQIVETSSSGDAIYTQNFLTVAFKA
jgi:SAM-dependent methyltransferase